MMNREEFERYYRAVYRKEWIGERIIGWFFVAFFVGIIGLWLVGGRS